MPPLAYSLLFTHFILSSCSHHTPLSTNRYFSAGITFCTLSLPPYTLLFWCCLHGWLAFTTKQVLGFAFCCRLLPSWTIYVSWVHASCPSCPAPHDPRTRQWANQRLPFAISHSTPVCPHFPTPTPHTHTPTHPLLFHGQYVWQ